jgi:Putative amidoligase enzyme
MIMFLTLSSLVLGANRTTKNPAFCDLSNQGLRDLIDAQTTFKGLVSIVNKSHYNPNRYFKLNLQNLVRHGNPRNTIEFRGHEGPTDATEIEI